MESGRGSVCLTATLPFTSHLASVRTLIMPVWVAVGVGVAVAEEVGHEGGQRQPALTPAIARRKRSRGRSARWLVAPGGLLGSRSVLPQGRRLNQLWRKTFFVQYISSDRRSRRRSGHSGSLLGQLCGYRRSRGRRAEVYRHRRSDGLSHYPGAVIGGSEPQDASFCAQ